MDGTATENRALRDAAVEGLTRQPKALSPKWLYDARGSALFEEITDVPEYYPTRTERAILESRLGEIAEYVPDGAVLVELGSGASVKTRLLLDGLPKLSGYVPVDISERFLLQTAAEIIADYPQLTVTPVVADFMGEIDLPDTGGSARVGFFPGSTLGNLAPDEATALLSGLRRWPDHAALIVGLDLVKAPEVLEAAYDDAQGVTGAFNLNLLERLNREAGANFDVEAFAHRAVWNAQDARIEMHLESERAQSVTIAGRKIAFEAGETIHTENSHKFTRERIGTMAKTSGWKVGRFLTDPDALFAVVVLLPA